MAKKKFDFKKASYKPSFRLETSSLKEGIGRFQETSEDKIKHFLDIECSELEQHMKNNHPFKNRTGDAEAGLRCYYQASRSLKGVGRSFRVILQHSVYYGQWLENRFDYGTKYAIVQPTFDYEVPKMMLKMKGLLD